MSGSTEADAPRLVLASASPRRRELLAALGVSFTVVPTRAEEEQRDAPVPAALRAALPPCPVPLAQHPTLLAWRKAAAVWQQDIADVVLAADTDVVLDGTVLGKPADAAHATTMLRQLAGRVHSVYTGLCVYTGQHTAPRYELVRSDVAFRPLSDADIAAYISTGEPLDKAGAYGIQGYGGTLVRQVSGSYTAIVGLPLHETWQLLTSAGITRLHDPVTAYHRWRAMQGKEREVIPCTPAQL